MTIETYFQSKHETLTRWRHHLHAHPGLLFDISDTADFVAEKLRAFGCDEVIEGIGQTGVVGIIRGRNATGNSAIGLRADMDALPIVEATGAPHASTRPGMMHACGHDGHTTMLLGAAQYLAERRDFDGTVAVIFQPAEEGGVGAKAMLDDGLVERFGLAEVYSLHNRPGLERGTFATRPSALMASVDIFGIEIAGKGGHAARPHHCIDPMLIASQTHLALQAIVARNVDPLDCLVISVTQIKGGDADNVIPHTAVLRGTVRTLNPSLQDFAEQRITEIATGIATAHGATATVQYDRVCAPTVNHPDQTHYAAEAAALCAGPDQVDTDFPVTMGGEDFSFMLQALPGAHMFIGNGPSAGLHHPEFDFDDSIIPAGCQYWVTLAQNRGNALAKGK